eukprot:358092-Chlamydomonas_euryale.AAC.3
MTAVGPGSQASEGTPVAAAARTTRGAVNRRGDPSTAVATTAVFWLPQFETSRRRGREGRGVDHAEERAGLERTADVWRWAQGEVERQDADPAP